MTGRPSDTPELAALICERITQGESLRSVCREDAVPAASTVFLWLARHKGFSDQYARSTAARATKRPTMTSLRGRGLARAAT
jgi:hypothetical protein